VDGASFVRHVSLGPKGSIWSAQVSYASAPDAPKFDIYLASVASPDPARGGVDDAGTLLEESGLTYVKLFGPIDTYAAAFTDDGWHGTIPFRLAGADLAPFTAFGANDAFGFRTINGGAGQYAVRLRINGKNAASTGYHLRVTELAFVRLDDFSYP